MGYLLRDRELPKIMPHHLRLDLNLIETLTRYTPITLPIISGTIIISRRCVLTVSGFSLGLASCLALRSFLIRPMGLRFEAAVEAAAGAGVDDVAELFGGEVEESVR